ncbi:MAG: hypothetical protein HY340_01380 [Candidatus Kerfeldbacteria bacterium]|nr:hypothetical protein [Candidatus Kerfeldbacteria bacterium]
MKRFILLYNGSATPSEQMSPEQMQKVMAGWTAWMEKTGKALVDIGAPMADGHAVVDDGSTGTATQLNGYSIVEATDMAAALKLVDGHPFLSDKTGKFTVEVFELQPVPMQQ